MQPFGDNDRDLPKERTQPEDVFAWDQFGHADVKVSLAKSRRDMGLRTKLPQTTAAIHLPKEGRDAMRLPVCGPADRDLPYLCTGAGFAPTLPGKLLDDSLTLDRISRDHQVAHQPAEFLERQSTAGIAFTQNLNRRLLIHANLPDFPCSKSRRCGH